MVIKAICPLILALVVSLTSCNRDNQKKSYLLGKWVADSTKTFYKKEYINTKDNTLQMVFKKDSMYWGFAKAKGYEVFRYECINNSLTINGEKMEIIKLTNWRLIYKRGDNDDLSQIDYFHKVKGNEW